MADSPRKRFSLKQLFPKCANMFLSGLQSGPGVTFASDHTDVHAFAHDVVARRKKTRKQGDAVVTETVWEHPALGIRAEVRYTLFPDTRVVEIDGRLVNRGRKTVRNVRGPFNLYVTTKLPPTCVPRLTTVYGGASTEGCFPPPAYALREFDLPMLGSKTLFGGRHTGLSTNTDMPYAIVTDPQRAEGFFCVLEWPCRWILMVSRSPSHLSVLGHVAYTGLDLKPGESLALPRAQLGFFQGDALDGSNALRRHIVRHVLRPVDGAPHVPPVCYNHWYGLGNDFTAEILKREADVYADLGVEYFVVDAGWYLGGFRTGIGNWTVADPKRFPNGMEEVAEHVRAKGMKFGSWLEIEYAFPDSIWAKEHPEWYREATGRPNLMYGTARYPDRLLRLDDPCVRAQVADFIHAWVARYGIEWIRWDFNDAPAPFWEAEEAEHEFGRLQIGYGQGLLALLDEVMTRCPQVHIEACAGGGHRMDLGTLRRAHSAWMNDNSSTVEAIRCFQAGVNRVLPGCFANSAFLWITHPRQRQQSLASLKKDGYPPYVIRSRMAGSLLFAEQTRFFTPAARAYLKREIANYKKMRPFLMQDYYPLFQPRTLQDYDGWQFHDPRTDEGYFMVFRVQSPNSAQRVSLRGLTPGRRYRLTNVDTGRTRTLLGGRSLRVGIDTINGTAWYHYRGV